MLEWNKWKDEDKIEINLLRSEALEAIVDVVQGGVSQLWCGGCNCLLRKRTERRASEISGQ